MAIEFNPDKFLDTEIINNEGAIETKVYRKTKKLTVPWASNIPKRYIKNTINTDLYRAKEITSNLNNELVIIKKKFLAGDFLINLLTVLSIRLLKKKVRKKKNI